MSLSGSLATDDPKTNEGALHYGDEPAGPGPSELNPAGVYPHALPEAASSAQQDRKTQPMTSGPGGATDTSQTTQAEAVPMATGGVPGTGNPGDSDKDPRVLFSNPMMFSEVMINLSKALTDTINAIENEAGGGISGVGKTLQDKFKGWRDEVDGFRAGKPVDAPHGQKTIERNEGGLYTD